MNKYDGADDMAYRIFELVTDSQHYDDDTVASNARHDLAERLRELARGNVDTKDWNL